MIQNDYMEVYFHEYCKSCKHKKTKETKDPCNECLSEPINLHSHKPINYEEAKNDRTKR